MPTCQDCLKLKRRPSKIKLLVDEPYCSVGVTNRKDDPHRKEGKCQIFEAKETEKSK